MGFEEQIASIVGKQKVHTLIDSLPENARVLFLIDTGSKYVAAEYGEISHQDALWMMRAFELSVLFPYRRG